MNGQKLFEKLSAMTESERKQCDFWWLVDKALVNNFLDQIKFDMKDFVDEKFLEEVADGLTDDTVSLMFEEIINEISEYAVDGYWDEYSSLILRKLEEYMRNKLIERKIEVPEF